MAGNPSRIYWDTSVFLCFLSEEEEQRRLICEDILKHAQDGHVELITSMYAIAEVIRPKAIKWPMPLTDEQVTLLEGMFKWPWLKKIQVHEELARSAAHLARDYGLKPADAIHAATAIEEKADELQRWDYDFTKIATLIQVTEPAYLSNLPLLNIHLPIGPTPDAFTAPQVSSIASEPPPEQSAAAAQASVAPSEPAPLSAPQGDPKPQPQGSSPDVEPPPPSKK